MTGLSGTVALPNRVGAAVTTAGVAAGLALLGAGFAGGVALERAAPIALLLIAVAAFHETLLTWTSLLAAIVLVIVFIPIKHYELPAALPISLEPYRLVVAVVAFLWVTSLLIDGRIRLRPTGMIDGPLLAFILAVLGSELANLGRVSALGPSVVKKLLFVASYIVVIYLVASVLSRYVDVEAILSVLVASGAVVAIFALIESRTGANPFHSLEKIIPMLKETGERTQLERGAVRAVGSAQHPVALGAALVVVIPLSIALAVTKQQIRWWLALAALTLGAFSTVSRTALVMLAVIALVFLWLRPRQARRFLWVAIIPALVAVHFALPGTLGAFRKSFTTEHLITESQESAVGSGRLATFWPAIHNEFTPNPLVGEGFGTRVTTPDEYVKEANAPILDDQWLGILLETGILGTAALAWLFLRFIRRLGRAAKEDDSDLGWMLAGIAAAVAAYAVSMFTFDAFSFVQVTFLMFILLGLGSAAVRAHAASQAEPPAT
jgi:hypothetical protein